MRSVPSAGGSVSVNRLRLLGAPFVLGGVLSKRPAHTGFTDVYVSFYND